MQGNGKLPSLKSLQAEQERLIQEQQRLYDERASLKKQAKQIDTIKANVDSLLYSNPKKEGKRKIWQRVDSKEPADSESRARCLRIKSHLVLHSCAAFQGLSDFAYITDGSIENPDFPQNFSKNNQKYIDSSNFAL